MTSAYTHIYLMESETTENWDFNDLVKISFNRNLGVDHTVDDKDTLVIDIENGTNMYIQIQAEYYYNNLTDKVAKSVYLNGQNITPEANTEFS